MNFGVLTLATPNDYLKAIGLALSLRVSNPDVPVAVACSPKIRPLMSPYFTHIIDEDPTLRGFVHKVHLDRYTPFDETMFFDSDVLVFRPLRPFIDKWEKRAYAACGHHQTDGFSCFGLDRKKILEKTGKNVVTVIEGAGHALFRKPECRAVFDMAREITQNYQDWAGNIPYADEDVITIVMTAMDLPPIPHGEFFSRHLSAKPGTLKMDATKGKCEFIATNTNNKFMPCMMHFAADEAPVAYSYQLWKLFRHFNVPTKGLANLALTDFYRRELKLRIHNKLAFLRRKH